MQVAGIDESMAPFSSAGFMMPVLLLRATAAPAKAKMFACNPLCFVSALCRAESSAYMQASPCMAGHKHSSLCENGTENFHLVRFKVWRYLCRGPCTDRGFFCNRNLEISYKKRNNYSHFHCAICHF
jgi:hypothetical protein